MSPLISDNPHPAAATGFALDGHHLIALTGRDAVAFAQAQTMNDVATLADGHWQWNGWLTPKGRLIALFALLRLDAETLWLVVADADPRNLATQLQRFVFRSKVAITVRDDLHVSGSFQAPAIAAGAHAAGNATDGVELDLTADGDARAMRIGFESMPPDATGSEAWRAADLHHGLVRLPPGHEPQWTPQQLSLDRLRAYSVKKGCYPGQEIVARTHFLGQAKRGLVLLQGQADVALGEVEQAGRTVGAVVSTSGTLALAVLPLDVDTTQPLTVAGQPLVLGALLPGLAR